MRQMLISAKAALTIFLSFTVPAVAGFVGATPLPVGDGIPGIYAKHACECVSPPAGGAKSCKCLPKENYNHTCELTYDATDNAWACTDTDVTHSPCTPASCQ